MPPPATADGLEYWDINQVLDHRDTKQRGREYLVSWVGFPQDQNSWEPESGLGLAASPVEEYQLRHNLPLRPPPAFHENA